MTPRKPRPPESQSWDDYWAEQEATAATEVICGVTVRIPTEMTLGFSKRLDDLDKEPSEENAGLLVSDLFGEEAFDQWVANGMGPTQFTVVLGWGIAHAQGNPISFAEAHQVVKDLQSGKRPAANRADRRAASKPRSSTTGGPSKPTSARTTASPRRTSRA